MYGSWAKQNKIQKQPPRPTQTHSHTLLSMLMSHLRIFGLRFGLFYHLSHPCPKMYTLSAKGIHSKHAKFCIQAMHYLAKILQQVYIFKSKIKCKTWQTLNVYQWITMFNLTLDFLFPNWKKPKRPFLDPLSKLLVPEQIVSGKINKP